MKIEPIAYMENEFPEKFGLPRQSGLVGTLKGRVVLERSIYVPEMLRGLEEFSHLWLIWGFSEHRGWSPTVRPPRLGGNKRMGVFATRSPFRPNALGISAVRLEAIDLRRGILTVAGADLMNGTPIYDIKPYLPFADSIPDASGGFAEQARAYRLQVVLPQDCPITGEEREALIGVLEQDPRPSYQNDPARVYGFTFGTFTVKFTVEGQTLTVLEVANATGGAQK